jgi:hypothetical protein
MRYPDMRTWQYPAKMVWRSIQRKESDLMKRKRILKLSEREVGGQIPPLPNFSDAGVKTG